MDGLAYRYFFLIKLLCIAKALTGQALIVSVKTVRNRGIAGCDQLRFQLFISGVTGLHRDLHIDRTGNCDRAGGSLFEAGIQIALAVQRI